MVVCPYQSVAGEELRRRIAVGFLVAIWCYPASSLALLLVRMQDAVGSVARIVAGFHNAGPLVSHMCRGVTRRSGLWDPWDLCYRIVDGGVPGSVVA